MKSQNTNHGYYGSLIANGFDRATADCVFAVSISQIYGITRENIDTVRSFLDSGHGARLGRILARTPGYGDSPLAALTECMVNGLVETELSNYIYGQRRIEQLRPADPDDGSAGWLSGIIFSIIASLLAGGVLFATACIFGFVAMLLLR